jgi:hypothetical protein
VFEVWGRAVAQFYTGCPMYYVVKSLVFEEALAIEQFYFFDLCLCLSYFYIDTQVYSVDSVV